MGAISLSVNTQTTAMSVPNIEKFFDKVDADGSGSITIDELNQLFARFDKDGSGKLDANEFAAGMAAELGATRTQADKTFKGLDTDGSGDVTLTEMGEMFKQMDKDGSGDICKPEFVAWWTSILK